MVEQTQMSRDQIDAAEAAGILSPKQAKAMRNDVAGRDPDERLKPSRAAKAAGPDQDAVIGNEDHLRFLRSFGDVFIGIGLVLLALGVSAIVAIFGGGPVFLVAAVGAYGLAEYFGRYKRSHFPTLITALAFLLFVQTGLSGLASVNGILAALITVAAMAIFYARIRLPFCIALIAIALLYLLFAFLGQVAPDLLRQQFGWILVSAGLAIFAVALLYDTQDLHRRTRFADNAFWLHILAAPMIIHGLVGYAVMEKAEFVFDVLPVLSFTPADATIILAATAVITVIGLAINRRALIVSSLGYAGLAIAFLVKQTELNLGSTLSITLILLGAAIVLLGVAWHPVRNQLIRVLPQWRVFPPPYVPLETNPLDTQAST
ncbi:hypothetical protein GCM10009069_08820 [Algimonas arctica]|uniref:Uncharacterized protein n=2 Tax=Algimonas arctica TaxID=1479486 RepID=A0A8J3G1Q4_9PROT|nr:hypothetical protein GCM10009069_08820 [Algimonas arctica]